MARRSSPNCRSSLDTDACERVGRGPELRRAASIRRDTIRASFCGSIPCRLEGANGTPSEPRQVVVRGDHETRHDVEQTCKRLTVQPLGFVEKEERGQRFGSVPIAAFGNVFVRRGWRCVVPGDQVGGLAPPRSPPDLKDLSIVDAQRRNHRDPGALDGMQFPEGIKAKIELLVGKHTSIALQGNVWHGAGAARHDEGKHDTASGSLASRWEG